MAGAAWSARSDVWIAGVIFGGDMCGIAGIAGNVDQGIAAAMADSIRHRGPDDGGVFMSPSGLCCLASRRLSILDLSESGHMPMRNEDGTIWAVYNGEVYNFAQLRSVLRTAGHVFRSHTDTEVLIHAYEEWGDAALEHLNGMFAIAIWDEGKGRLLLARDRLGIKPLYYRELRGGLAFASEVKALGVVGMPALSPDLTQLPYYLNFLWVPGPQTMFKDVFKLQPGHKLTWCRGNEPTISRFVKQSESAGGEGDGHAHTPERLLEVLTDAVSRQIVSDVPVGLMLSGGLDSTILLALVSQLSGPGVRTYTTAFRSVDSATEQSSADSQAAKRVANLYGAKHSEIVLNPDVVSLLSRVAWHLDEPIADPAAINTLLISEAAATDVKVLLSGQGADEVFGGYNVYLANQMAERLDLMPAAFGALPGLGADLACAAGRMGISPGVMSAVSRNLAQVEAVRGLGNVDRAIRTRSYYAPGELGSLLASQVREAVVDIDPFDRHRAHLVDTHGMSGSRTAMRLDMATFLPELNLAYCDKMSMAASIETRVPFLDNEVVSFMAGAPDQAMIRRFRTKSLLRDAVAGCVPRDVLTRRKAGFAAPIRSWLRRDLVSYVDDLLSPKAIADRGLLNAVAVRTMIEEDRRGEADHAYRIWAILNLEVWFRTFFAEGGL